jgi:hypothetical protein
MNEKECSRSVPIRNVPHHRKDSMYNIYMLFDHFGDIIYGKSTKRRLQKVYEYEVLFHDGME